MATINLIQMKRSATPGKEPTTQDLALGEFGINTHDGRVFIKKDDGMPEIIEVGAKGSTSVQNVFYVSKSGNDANDGKSLDRSKLTIKSAVAAARQLVATATATVVDGAVTEIYVTNPGAGYELPLIPSVTIFGDGTGARAVPIISGGSVTGFTILDGGIDYTYADIYITPAGFGPTGAGATIFVKSGDYTEDNPIFVPAGVCIVGDSLRAVTVRPQNPTLDMFWVNNKSYFTEMTFRDHKSPAAVIAFPSVDITGIENTNPARVTFSGVFTYDRVKCSRDVGLIVDSLAQDLKFPSTNGNSQSVFAGLQYWTQSGYSIANTPSNSEVLPTLSALEYLKTQISELGNVDASVATTTSGLLDVIIDILNGTTNPASVTDLIVPNDTVAQTSTKVVNAYAAIQTAKTTIENNVVSYIQDTYPLLSFNGVTCARDVGYILDSVCYDLLYNGNRQVIQSGIYYLGFSTTDSAIPGEVPQVTAAYNFLKTLIEPIVTGTAVASAYQTKVSQVLPTDPTAIGTTTEANLIKANITEILDIINNGPSAAPAQEPIGLTATSTDEELYAYDLLVANRDFIRAEVIAYIDRETTAFDRAKCYRDVGLIVDALAQDVYFTGATQSTFAGIQYWSQNSLTTSSELGAGEKAATIATFGFIRDLVKDVVENITSGGSVVHYAPGTYTQDVSNPAATATEAGLLGDNFDLIISILNADSTTGVTDQIVPNSIVAATGDKAQAVANIVANYDYIKEQAAKYIQATYPAVYATYDAVKCARDVGYILDSVTVDLLYGGNRQSIQSAVYYYTYNSTSFVPTEIQQIEKAYSYIKILSSYIIRGLPMPYLYQEGEPQVFETNPGTLTQVTEVQNKVSLILDIINDYQTTNPLFEKAPLPTTPSGTAARQYAAEQLLANRDFISAEVLAYLEGYTYNRTTCSRDTGLIVDALVQDLLFDGDSQSTFAAIQYWSQTAERSIPTGELAATEAAIDFVITQTNALSIRTTDKTNIANGFGLIRNLLDGTVDVATITSGIVPNSIEPDRDAQAAYDALQEAKAQIIDDTIADIAGTFPSFDQPITGATAANPVVLTITGHAFADGDSIRINSVEGMVELNGNRYYTKNTGANTVALYLDSTLATSLDGSAFTAYETGGYADTQSAAKCRRDLGYMIDSVSFDLLYNADPTNTVQSNRQAVQSGVYYWNHSTTTSIVPGEKPVVTAAYDYIKTLSSYIVKGKDVPTTYGTVEQVKPEGSTAIGTQQDVDKIVDKIDLMINIINAGPSVAPEPSPISLTRIGSFNYNRTKCSRDLGLIVDAIAQDIKFPGTSGDSQTVFAGLQYWTQTGFSIPNISPSAEVAATIGALGELKAEITAVAAATSATTDELINTIISIINGGIAAEDVTDLIVPNDAVANTGGIATAYAAIQAAKATIQSNIVDWVDTNYPTLAYNSVTCSRDVGYIIDSVCYDLLYNGNRQSIQSGIYYLGFSSTESAVAGEIPQVTAAYQYLKSILPSIIEGTALTTTYQTDVAQVTSGSNGTSTQSTLATNAVDTILDIINNGPGTYLDVGNRTPIGLAAAGGNANNTYTRLQANRAFIQAEVIAYIDSRVVAYDHIKCSRDLGLIVDALAQDLKFPGLDGNSQSMFAGLQYWTQADGYSVPNGSPSEKAATLDALAYLKTQVAGLAGVTIDTTTNALFDTIIDILDGTTPPASVTDLIEPNGTTASAVTAVTNAYTAIQTAKATLPAATVAYIQGLPAYSGLVFDTATCERDVEYILDSISYDVLYGGNRQAIQSGIYYLNFSSTVTAIPNEVPQVTAAYQYLKSIIPSIVAGTPVATLYQTDVAQVTSGSSGAGAAASVQANVDLILDIIINGPNAYITPGTRTPIGLVAETDSTILNAYNKLVANRDFLRAEIIAYIDYVLQQKYQTTANAAYLLNANRAFIVSELIGFVDENYAIQHPYASGDTISIRKVTGMTEVNNGYIHSITNATNTIPVRLTFDKGHTFGNTMSMRVSAVGGMNEVNGNRYYARFLNTTEVELFNDVKLTDPVDGTLFGVYTSGGQAETDSYYYVRKIDGDSIDLYLDKALTQPVDATSWGTYITGGVAGTGALPVSPYVHNCSSITTTGTGMRVDGNLSTGLKSMVLDSFTQINEGGNGIEIINRGYAQLVSIYTICTDIGILCKDGGFCSVANSDSSFGTYALVADGLSEVLYSGVSDGDLQIGKSINLKGLTHRPNYGDAMDVTSVLNIIDATIVVASATVSDPGTGYAPSNIITVTGTTGTDPTFRVSTVKIVGTPTVASQSGTWAVGDRITFTRGFSTPAVLEVATLSGSAISTVTIIEPGVKNTAVTGSAVTPDIVPAGTSVSFNLTFGVASVGVATFGDIAAIPVNPAVTSGAGTGATLNVTYSIRLQFDDSHYFRGDEAVEIASVGGMTDINGNTYFIKLTGIADKADLHVDAALLLGVDVTGFGTYGSGGTATLHDYYTVVTATEGAVATAGTYEGLRQSRIGLEISVKRPIVNESTVEFRQRSIVSSSGHTFEYIGSGNILSTATPESGAYPIPENEVVELRGGKAYFTGTNEQGDFKIGTELVINRDTGTISGRTFNKSLFAVLTPYILAIEG